VTYIRVSTEEQAYEGYSLPDQERAARLYAQARVAMQEAGWTEIDDDDVYADPGVSGTLRDRPGLNRLLADARAGKIGRVICTKLDRVGRTAALILSIEDELESCGVQRAYIKDSIDTTTATGRLLRTVLAAVAELERDMILERTSAGLHEALRRGAVYRYDVLGYRYIPSDRKKGQLARVEIDEDTAPLVVRIFTAVASGTSLHEVARQLNAEGIPTLRGAAYWRVGTLRKIIYNPLYAGRATHGRTRNVKTAKGTYTTVAGNTDKLVYIDAPAIIAPELAQAAQDQLARNRIQAKRNAKGEYLLGGGLLRCGVLLADGQVCGSTMRGETGAAPRAPRYRCSHVTPAGGRSHSLLSATIETAVWRALRATLTDSSTALEDIKALADASSAQAAQAEAELRTTERAIAEIDAQRDALLDLHLNRRLDAERFSAKDAALLAKQQALIDQHAALAARRNAAIAQQLPIAEIEDLCRRLAGRLDDLTFAQRQRLVRTLFTSVVTDRKTVHLEGAFNTLSMTVALGEDGAQDGSIAATTVGRGSRRAAGRAG
jgi:site-specific DNA recombinase